MSVLLETSFGDIVIDLFTQKAPTACLNFIKLCKIKYYNNSLFLEVQKSIHRLIQIMSPRLKLINQPPSGRKQGNNNTTLRIKSTSKGKSIKSDL